MHTFTFFLKWGSIGYSPGVVYWDFIRRDHPGNLGRVSGSGLVITCRFTTPDTRCLEIRANSGYLGI